MLRADCTEISFDRDKKKMINSDCGIRIDSNQHFIEFNTGGSWEGEPGRIHQSSAALAGVAEGVGGRQAQI